jgi:hypothetical protein
MYWVFCTILLVHLQSKTSKAGGKVQYLDNWIFLLYHLVSYPFGYLVEAQSYTTDGKLDGVFKTSSQISQFRR